ncbi:hypothetical protein B0H12DRAFT_164885 [Mycena haematopus]|nr:hypothetical protein B0H12DRAFT_164885 [Mycena haematopus]
MVARVCLRVARLLIVEPGTEGPSSPRIGRKSTVNIDENGLVHLVQNQSIATAQYHLLVLRPLLNAEQISKLLGSFTTPILVGHRARAFLGHSSCFHPPSSHPPRCPLFLVLPMQPPPSPYTLTTHPCTLENLRRACGDLDARSPSRLVPPHIRSRAYPFKHCRAPAGSALSLGCRLYSSFYSARWYGGHVAMVVRAARRTSPRRIGGWDMT